MNAALPQGPPRLLGGYRLLSTASTAADQPATAVRPGGSACWLFTLPQGASGLERARARIGRHHPNLVEIVDAGRAGTTPYVATALVEGRLCDELLTRLTASGRAIPSAGVLLILQSIVAALEYSRRQHAAQATLHPRDICVSWKGEARLLELGVVGIHGDDPWRAPDLAAGARVDGRADAFAIGKLIDAFLPFLAEPSEKLAALAAECTRPAAADRPASLQLVYTRLRDAGTGDARALGVLVGEIFGGEIAAEIADRDQRLAELPSDVKTTALNVDPRGETQAMATPPEPLPVAPPAVAAVKPAPVAVVRPAPVAAPVAAPVTAKPAPVVAAKPAPAPVAVTAKPVAPARQESAPVNPVAHEPTVPVDDQPLRSTRVSQPVEPKRFSPPPRHLTGPVIEEPEPPLDDERALTPPRPVTPTQQRMREEPKPIAAPPDSEQVHAGQVIGARYRIEKMIGTGGMGSVYEAEHVEIGKKVAVKILHPQLSNQADLVARFRREARAASRIGHPNIVDVTDFGSTPNGNVYFVMERLEGVDLAEVLRHERRLAPDRAVLIGVQICRALAAAHTAGIIHRDLKPENIFLIHRDGNSDFVKILDFGIAKSDMGNQNTTRRLTTPGIAMGTPEYMAPEQAAGKPIDGRVDIYAVGAMLYELITSRPPHSGNTVMEILAKKANNNPRPIRETNPECPPALEHVIIQCLEREPGQRPQTMSQLEYELNKSLRGRGQAVASVLGIKVDDAGPIGWGEEARPKMDTPPREVPPPVAAAPLPAGDQTPLGFATTLPPLPSTTPVRLSTQELEIAEEVDEEPIVEPPTLARGGRPIAPALQPRPPSSTNGLLVTITLGAIIVAGGAFVGWVGGVGFWRPFDEAREPYVSTYVPPPPAPPIAPTPVPNPTPTPNPNPTGATPTEPTPAARADVGPLLEWARRTVEGNRIYAPPGDNLKDLLARIDKISPQNPDALALRGKTANQLRLRGANALRSRRLEEAEKSFRGVLALDPDDQLAKQELARALVLLAEGKLDNKKPQIAYNMLEEVAQLDPNNSRAPFIEADALLALRRPKEAAEVYEKILSGRPRDQAALRGLQTAKRQSNPPQRHRK